ncbi:acireductone synthase, partial [Erwinia amylovora]|nr:acireductone synthase [Erwinia amylovora]
ITGNPHLPAVALVLAPLRAVIDRPEAKLLVLIGLMFRCMDEVRKSSALNALQGIVLRVCYLIVCFTGHIYTDVLTSLQRWIQK